MNFLVVSSGLMGVSVFLGFSLDFMRFPSGFTESKLLLIYIFKFGDVLRLGVHFLQLYNNYISFPFKNAFLGRFF